MKKTPESRFQPGAKIGSRYQIIEVIGAGAVGTVLRANDCELDRDIVALKILHPHLVLDQTAFARFRNEVSISRQLSHPNIVRVFDFHELLVEKLHYISMECIDGPNLREYMDVHKGKKLAFPDVVRILHQVTAGLEFAHRKGVIHRDVKPSNIMLDTDGNAKLTDFGVAQSLRSSHGLTATGESLGTPLYMSPEHFNAEGMDHRSDIYSLGITAYEMATGRPPFEDEAYYTLAKKHLLEPLPETPLEEAHVPQWFISLIKRCTDKDKTARFRSCTELREYIRQHDRLTLENPRLKLKRTVLIASRRRYVHAGLWRIARTAWFIGITLGFFFTARDTQANMRFLTNMLMVEQGIKIDLSELKTALGYPPYAAVGPDYLLEAVRQRQTKLAEAIVAAGQSPETRDADGNTLLHLAVISEDIDLVAGIARHFPNLLNTVNRNSETALHMAVKKGQARTVGFLLHQERIVDASIKDSNGNTALHLAALLRSPQMVTHIITLQQSLTYWITNENGDTPLHIAVKNEDLETLKTLLSLGVDPNCRDAFGRTALMIAL
ncbi:MAG TPA: protein kinase, partial [Oligoflexia bacterium]|nr:protein kinase [Oligoflexia bacterium]